MHGVMCSVDQVSIIELKRARETFIKEEASESHLIKNNTISYLSPVLPFYCHRHPVNHQLVGLI